MNPSPEKIDQLVFSWDCQYATSKKVKNHTKTTSNDRRDLEEYFRFLDEVASDPTISKQKQLPVNKLFEL
jgi:hypothetical protein